MSWFLRSAEDRDTHYGELRSDGTVVAACGERFRPRFYHHRNAKVLAIPGTPPDPDQICETCDNGKKG